MAEARATKAKAKAGRAERPRLPERGEYLMTLDDIAAALRVSYRYVAQMVSSGEYPAADCKLGTLPRWHPETHAAWVRARAGKEG
jgi:hypothetical protein